MRIRVISLLVPLTAALAAGGCHRRSSPAAVAMAPDSARVRADIEYLASDALRGRATGTAGNDSAAAFAARRYAALRLHAIVPAYFQRFIARSAISAHGGDPAELPTQNVIAFLPGRDPVLRGQAIVIGAHIDHLGTSTVGALDTQAGDAIRNGADDNASGTAAVLELARLLSARPTRRSILFVNFSAEELGLLGSRFFVDHSPVPTDSIMAMLNFDMIGRMRGDSVIVYGVASARQLPALVDSANASLGLSVRAMGDGQGPSDHASFYARGIPVLHFFTNLHEDYHRATDDAVRINATGTARVIALAESVVRRIDALDGRLTFVRAPAAPPVATRTGTNVYLGSIPDMAAAGTPGLRLSGVRAGSPADSAGLRAGDVIVEFGGRPVSDLNTYSDALYAHKPGDVVDVVVLRDNARVALRVRLGRRGQ